MEGSEISDAFPEPGMRHGSACEPQTGKRRGAEIPVLTQEQHEFRKVIFQPPKGKFCQLPEAKTQVPRRVHMFRPGVFGTLGSGFPGRAPKILEIHSPAFS